MSEKYLNPPSAVKVFTVEVSGTVDIRTSLGATREQVEAFAKTLYLVSDNEPEWVLNVQAKKGEL